jgi:hypothetical protein
MTRTLRPPRVAEADPYRGAQRSYDLVKEFVVALVVVIALTAGLTALFSSPDEHAITIAQWSKRAPADFTATALSELDGTSGTATYGPPYNSASPGQKLGPLELQKLGGVRHRIDTARAFVLDPLAASAPAPDVAAALAGFRGADPAQQTRWTTAYSDALAAADGRAGRVRPGDYGPVPVLLSALLRVAQSGGLDGALLSQGQFFQSDDTASLLFLADGSYLEDKATAEHLAGDQWGMMNETGNYPGQAWLWLYTFWYQVKPFSTSENADALVWGLMIVLTVLFVLVPFLPGIRSLPRAIPIYRLIWRDHYRQRQPTGPEE